MIYLKNSAAVLIVESRRQNCEERQRLNEYMMVHIDSGTVVKPLRCRLTPERAELRPCRTLQGHVAARF
jgi:hypothetical protein